VDRQEDDLRSQAALPQFMDDVDPTQNRQGNISHDYVGTKAAGLRYQGFTILYISHYLKLRR
jgi:hypothetical protein